MPFLIEEVADEEERMLGVNASGLFREETEEEQIKGFSEEDEVNDEEGTLRIFKKILEIQKICS